MKRFLYAMSVILGLFILSACSSDNEKEADASKGNGSSKEGGTMVYARGADSVGLDPINITDGESIRVTHAIFETLFEYDKDLQLQPKLAESYKTSEDGLTWTLALKKGVTFHDGTDFNADAVVFNFERWMDTENEYHIGDFPYYPFLYGGFKGDEEHKIDYVKAVDEHTVEIKLKEKVAPFISYLAIPMFGIASPTAIEQYNERFYENPVGTGPFQFDSWTRNDKIVVKANENYYVENQPLLDQIIFTVVPDNSARLNVLLSGEADFIDGMNPEDAKTVEKDEKLKLVKRPSFNEGFMVMNTQKVPFDDVKVRQAINMAIDKKALVDGFYSGFADVAKSPVPPALWGYNDEIEDYKFDVKAAKALLAEAGYPEGFETEIWAMSNPRPYLPQPMKTAEAIQANLEEIGIKAKIVTYEWATYLEKTGDGQHPMALYGWTGVMADPDNFLYPNLSNTNMETPANNLAFYDNEEFQELIEQARVTFDQDERVELYKKAQERFHLDAPWVPLAHTTPPIAFADYVKGFEPHPMENDNYAVMYLDK
ncbi:ABC transporter substrate-binding protein [Sporosarcina newyorkensis]|uniref:Peptide/nickel transport system substrate-binding protein n=2 Tax=Sporosarcina newyorkensis TaxID=759851 RepID=A0A1T4YY87_9BACL|nr:ABC transporter substrate-binding protein [Sporosarcina newyorkensis]EGQ24123.1 heme ABC superfamily ATP binding cassette transporter, binding protein [Sporosarcina newyorkensis 2681]SKB06528.1 peptide/nickel transport system substrate-binding protein [Sporosarcina newyorkensis]